MLQVGGERQRIQRQPSRRRPDALTARPALPAASDARMLQHEVRGSGVARERRSEGAERLR